MAQDAAARGGLSQGAAPGGFRLSGSVPGGVFRQLRARVAALTGIPAGGREAQRGGACRRRGARGREAGKGKPRTDFPEDFPAHFGAFCHRAPSRALRAERAVEVSRWLFPEASPAHSEAASAGLPIRLPGIQQGSIPNSPNIIPPASPHRRKPQIRIPERMPLQVPKPQAQPPSHHSLDPIRPHSRAPATPKSGSSAPPRPIPNICSDSPRQHKTGGDTFRPRPYMHDRA